MTVKELIKQLKNCDENLEVCLHYDGAPRLICDGGYVTSKFHKWYSKTGEEKVCPALVLCEVEDVYAFNEEDDKWVFKHE